MLHFKERDRIVHYRNVYSLFMDYLKFEIKEIYSVCVIQRRWATTVCQNTGLITLCDDLFLGAIFDRRFGFSGYFEECLINTIIRIDGKKTNCLWRATSVAVFPALFIIHIEELKYRNNKSRQLG